MGQVLVNGQFEHTLNPLDRGLLYGDGFFTTVKVVDGRPRLWSYHLQRLQLTAHRLQFLPLDIPAIERDLSVLCEHSELSAFALRITFTRGAGGRGYAVPEGVSPTRIMSTHPLPGNYQGWMDNGIRLGFSKNQLGHTPLLSGLKTLNRMEQVLLKKELADHAGKYDDLVVTDDTGMVCETTAANLFWYDNGEWYTPGLNRSGVAGVIRRWLTQHLTVTQGEFLPDSLHDAQQIFICNALMGVIPVRALADKPLVPAIDLAKALTARLDEDS